MNPITNYSSNYIAPQAEAVEKFEKDHPGAKVTFTFQDKRALAKNDKDSKRNELVKIRSSEAKTDNTTSLPSSWIMPWRKTMLKSGMIRRSVRKTR